MKRLLPKEDRECLDCKGIYQWTERNLLGLCPRCVSKRNNARQRLKPEEKKKPYPLEVNEMKRRYRRIIKELDAAETTEERQVIYARELDYMIEIGIYEWCVDLRHTPELKNPGSGKRGRKFTIQKQLPNTKDWNDEQLD
jgi:hypothetical protein